MATAGKGGGSRSPGPSLRMGRCRRRLRVGLRLGSAAAIWRGRGGGVVAAWRPLCFWLFCLLKLGRPSMWVGSPGLCMRLGDTGVSGHAVNPSMEARWRHPWRPTVPIRRYPRGAERSLRAVGKSRGESRSKKQERVSEVGGDDGKRGACCAASGPGVARCVGWWLRVLGAAQRATRFSPSTPSHSTRFSLLVCSCLSLPPFPSALRHLSGPWATGWSGPWGAMDGATEPPWMGLRRVPTSR